MNAPPTAAPRTSPAGGRLSLGLRLVAAAILLQTLFFKFTGAAESVYIFEKVGQEPWGRYGSGVVELIAAGLLFLRPTRTIGAGLALGVISGAIFFHLTKLGIVVQDDGGLLFVLALVVWLCAAWHTLATSP
jgi:putative oxidoreductase